MSRERFDLETGIRSDRSETGLTMLAPQLRVGRETQDAQQPREWGRSTRRFSSQRKSNIYPPMLSRSSTSRRASVWMVLRARRAFGGNWSATDKPPTRFHGRERFRFAHLRDLVGGSIPAASTTNPAELLNAFPCFSAPRLTRA